MRIFCFLALSSVALAGALVHADEPVPQELVQKVVRAAGGEDKLLKLFRIRERLNVSADPKKEGKERVSVLEPPNFWWLGKRERVKDEKEPATFLVWAWTLDALIDPKSKVEVIADVHEGEKPAFGLRVSGTVTPPMDLYFDEAENRLVRIDWRQDIHRFSDWKEHDGVKYPAKCVGYKKTGRPWYFSEIIELERLKELPEGLKRSARHELTVSGTRFALDGEPFPFTGVSFFNAIYNPAFNKDSTTRREWLHRFQQYGINVLRVMVQWDSKRGFVDAGPEKTLYHADGRLRDEHLATLKAILRDADAERMVIQLCLFSHGSWREGTRLSPEAAGRAVESLTQELQPWRNLAFQIWNEHHDEQVLPLVKLIKAQDPKRLVTSSPGFSGVLGPELLNQALDYLTPHTSRQNKGRTWDLAPREIAKLLAEFSKPVVDDEPARNGTANFGGPKEVTSPYDHITQIHQVWQVGGHVVYHHDMFQTGYGTSAVPPSGIPDPEFSPYHKQVFEFLSLRERYAPQTINESKR